jgi:hypothetical protein
MQLTALEEELLNAGEFYLDGWTNPKSLEAAGRLVNLGFLQMFESGSDEAQYTALNFSITENGKLALKSLSENL